MKYEGVNFFEGPVSAMQRDEFIASHMGLFWTDRKREVRKKMLGEVYDLIVPKENSVKV